MKTAGIKFLLVLFSLSLIAAASGNIYVQSRSAKVFASPSFKAKVVTVAKKAQKLTVLEKSRRWYKVSYRGKEGWVSALVVSKRPPMKRVSVAGRDKGKIKKYARRRASVVTATAAARGLTEDDRRRLGNRGSVDFASLEMIEGLVISEAELDSFIKQTK